MLKDPLAHLLREPSAEVADRRANHAIDCRIRRKHHTAEMSGRLLHGIKSVQHQIEENLLKLYRVGLDPGRLRSELSDNSAGISHRIRVGQADYILYYLVHIHDFAGGITLPYHFANTADDFPSTFPIGSDIEQKLMQFLDVDNALINEPLTCSGVGNDRGQGLVEFVSQRSSHFSHQCDPTEMGEFLPMTLGLECALTSFRDIERRSHHLQSLPARAVDRASPGGHPPHGTTRSNDPMDDIVVTTVRHSFGDRFLGGWTIVRMKRLQKNDQKLLRRRRRNRTWSGFARWPRSYLFACLGTRDQGRLTVPPSLSSPHFRAMILRHLFEQEQRQEFDRSIASQGLLHPTIAHPGSLTYTKLHGLPLRLERKGRPMPT